MCRLSLHGSWGRRAHTVMLTAPLVAVQLTCATRHTKLEKSLPFSLIILLRKRK